jgi:hypothetical protein
MFFDRPALRFTLNARPPASQGEAPARAIKNMKCGKTENGGIKQSTRIERTGKNGISQHIGNDVYTKSLTSPFHPTTYLTLNLLFDNSIVSLD